MIVKRAHHVSFRVSDLDRARAFYGDLLGLSPIERPDFGFPGAWYQAGEVQVHLIVAPPEVDTGSPPPGINPLANHAAFEIEDYRAVREALASRGVPLVETGAEVGQLFLQDPDGNVIELIRPGGRLGASGRPRR